jgi:hypothetical protein
MTMATAALVIVATIPSGRKNHFSLIGGLVK